MRQFKSYSMALVLATAFLVPAWCFCAGPGMAGHAFASDAPSSQGAAAAESASCHGSAGSLGEDEHGEEGPGDGHPCEAPGGDCCPCMGPLALTPTDELTGVLSRGSIDFLLTAPAALLPQGMRPHTFFQTPGEAALAERRAPQPPYAHSLLSQRCLLTL